MLGSGTGGGSERDGKATGVRRSESPSIHWGSLTESGVIAMRGEAQPVLSEVLKLC